MPRRLLSNPDGDACRGALYLGYGIIRFVHHRVGCVFVAHVLDGTFFPATTLPRALLRNPTPRNLDKNDLNHTRPLSNVF